MTLRSNRYGVASSLVVDHIDLCKYWLGYGRDNVGTNGRSNPVENRLAGTARRRHSRYVGGTQELANI